MEAGLCVQHILTTHSWCGAFEAEYPDFIESFAPFGMSQSMAWWIAAIQGSGQFIDQCGCWGRNVHSGCRSFWRRRI